MRGVKIDKLRLFSIFMLAFLTTLAATGFNTTSAIINAILLGGIALFTELRFKDEGIKKVQIMLSEALFL